MPVARPSHLALAILACAGSLVAATFADAAWLGQQRAGGMAQITHALRQAAAEVLAGAPEVILQRMVAGRHDLIPPGYPERIGRIRAVQQKEGRLWGY